MARSSRSSARPAARPAAPMGGAGQTRQSSTAAYPAQHAPSPAVAHPPHAGAAAGQRPPGLLAQAASTMGGAVAGSVVGHGISNMLFGGRSEPAPQAQAAQEPVNQAQFNQGQGASCDIQAKDFTKCLEATQGDMQGCAYYLEALKACQAAARPY